MTSPNMSTPTAGHGTAMVRTRVLALFKTADVCIIPLGEFDKSYMIIKSASSLETLFMPLWG
jgi:hypothetical protein